MYDFLEKIIGHVIWPCTIIILAFGFKAEFKSIVSRINKAKFKDVEISLERELNSIKEAATNIGIAPSYSNDFLEKNIGIVDVAPEWAFIQSWNEIENNLSAIFAISRGDKRRKGNSNYVLETLENEKFISSDIYKLIVSIRSIRNRIVHNKSEITKGEVIEWLGISTSVIELLKGTLDKHS